MMKSIIVFFALFLSLCYSSLANALPNPACVATGGTPVAGAMAVPTTALYTPFLTLTMTYNITCTNRANAVNIRYSPSGSIGLVSGTTTIWSTGYPGLGVIVSETSPTSQTLSTLAAGQTGTLATMPAHTTTLSVSLKFSLVRTGTISAGTAGTLTLFAPYPEDASTSQTGANMTAVAIGLPTFTSGGCTVATSSISVTLPKVSSRSFVNSSYAGATPLSIGLNCQSGVRVLASFNDANNASNSSSILSLSPSSTASGIGLQLLTNSGSAITLSPLASPVNTDFGLFSGAASVLLLARYVATGGSIVAGTATGNAIFTMTYQ